MSLEKLKHVNNQKLPCSEIIEIWWAVDKQVSSAVFERVSKQLRFKLFEHNSFPCYIYSNCEKILEG
jgi:hypothetical protein